MATNAEDQVADDNKEVTEDDLRSLKYNDDGVETSQEEDEPAEDTEDGEESEDTGEDSDVDSEEDEQSDSSDKPSFVKEFQNIKGDTPEEYAKNLEEAYKNSTAEALRLKGIADAPPTAPEQVKQVTEDDKDVLTSPLELYAQQQLDREIADAYTKFQINYPQVTDPVDYNKFTVEVATLSNTIYTSQKRLASPDELYEKAAIILGWEKESVPSSKDKLGIAVKTNTASPKTTSAVPKGSSKSKVTDVMIRVNRAMYPGKSDADIRKELEPYVY